MLMMYKVCLALAVGLTLVFAFQAYYADFIGPFSNAIAPIIASAALISAGFASRKYVTVSGKFRSYGPASQLGWCCDFWGS